MRFDILLEEEVRKPRKAWGPGAPRWA